MDHNNISQFLHSSTLSSTSALDGGRWSLPSSGYFATGIDPAPIVPVAGWAPPPPPKVNRTISNIYYIYISYHLYLNLTIYL